MKRNAHKRFAWVLTVCMLITLIPATALAAELPAPTGLKLGSTKIGNTQYYGSTNTQLYVQWDEIDEMQWYHYQVDTNCIASGSGIRFPGGVSGNGAGPLASPFYWTVLNNESVDYHVDKITVALKDDNDNLGPAATLDTDITIRQVEATSRLTAYYIETKTITYDGGSYEEAIFQISGVAPDHSAHFELQRGRSGSGEGTKSSSTGIVEISDSGSIRNGQLEWSMSLGDLEVNAGDEYYLDVYDATFESDTKAAMTITRYPVDIAFNSFDITAGGSLTYTGSQITPEITVKTVAETPKTLKKDVDYTLSFEKNGTAISANQIVNAGAYTVVIEGKAGTDYAGKIARKTFTVAKATPAAGSYTVPKDLTAVYGQTLKNIALPTGFTWQDTDTTPVGNFGTNTFKVQYNPDAENYNSVTGIDVSVEVAKANQTKPSLALSSATGILGLTPPAITLTGGGGEGALHYVSSNTDVAAVDEATGVITLKAAGSAEFTVKKDGDSNYEPSDESDGVTLTVKDKVDFTVKDTAAADAATAAELKNQGQINVGTLVRTGLTNEFTVAVNGKAALTTYASGDTQQAEGKWFGLLIGNLKVNDGSVYAAENLFYKISADTSYMQFTPADESRTLQAGGTENEFVYWIRSDVDPSKTIWLATSESGENEAKLTVNFTPYQAPSHHGGNGSGGGASAPQTPAASESKTSTKAGTTTVSTTVTAATNAKGTATVTVAAETITGMIEKAKEAEKQNKDALIEINVKTGAGTKTAEVTIEKSVFKTIARDTRAQVRVETGIGSITFDEKALETIGSKADSDISIRMEAVDGSSLSNETKALVGDRPVYDFTVSSGNTKVSSFNGGTADISIPYDLKPGEDENAVVVYYIDDNGSLQNVKGVYRKETGAVEFSVSHFSQYAVGYHKVSFSDVNDSAWYSGAVTFLSARGITTGTSANMFSPNAAITRGEFIVMLMRAYGIEPVENSVNNFADAGSTYYTKYLAAAKELKITQGVGNNQYQPDKKISRQDMFTLLYRALDVLNEVPDDKDAKTKFSDSAAVADYAETAVDTLVSAGVVSGSNGMLDPAGVSTRAQMAQILKNLLSE